MKFEVVNDIDNPYLDRREIEIMIYHEGIATPKRIDLFKQVIEKFSLNPAKTLLMSIHTVRGTNTSLALIYYYQNGIDWSTIEPVKRDIKVIGLGEEDSEEKS